MSRFGIQLKQRHDMKHMTHIATLALSVLLALTACEHNRHTPEEDKVPLSFSALSQNTPTKADADVPTFPHADFGVWGIARNSEASSPYILWEETSMVEVTKLTSGAFAPVSAAYWLPDHTFTFIAVAPYTGGVDGLIPAAVDKTNDSFKFTFDMGPKYTASEDAVAVPDFDLMGSVARTYVEKATGKKPQELTFRHLLAKININITFVDASGNTLSNAGSVSKIQLDKINTTADYTLSFDQSDALSIRSENPAEPESVIFKDTASATLHVVPQNITGTELYLDFTRDGAAFQDFKAVLKWDDKTKTYYNYNEVYNWNISIGPKNAITFKVEVAPWGEEQVNDEDIEII